MHDVVMEMMGMIGRGRLELMGLLLEGNLGFCGEYELLENDLGD